MAAYISQSDLENRISANVVKQIYDDNSDGSADTNPIAQLIADACSKIDSYLRSVFSYPFTGTVPNEVKRLALDVAQSYARQRHPEYVRGEWEPLMKQAERDLEKIRDGDTVLDVPASADPIMARNQGGIVYDHSRRMIIDGSDGTFNGGDL